MNLEDYATEIVPNLWVGERWGCKLARERGFSTICVLEYQTCSNSGCLFIPVLKQGDRQVTLDEKGRIQGGMEADPDMLTWAHHAIDESIRKGPVLVHCVAGIERSPLTVATWLCERQGMTLDEAYDLVIDKRFVVERRNHWLDKTTRDYYEKKRLIYK
jgi:hypothetical protein